MHETILFVDDDPNLLQGLQRMLRPKLDEWEMTFVSSGKLALEAMGKTCFSVVVVDMRMPEMDGAELLSQIKVICPKSVRIILSGQAELPTIMKVIGSTHQYLAKPCDAELLKITIERASQLRQLMKNDALEEFISQLFTLPAQSDLYDAVQKEIESKKPAIEKIIAAISCDMSMAAKVLQLVNSAFFAPKQEVINVREAVRILGVELLRTLVCSHKIFSRSDSCDLGDLNLTMLNQHSISIGNFAQRIALLDELNTSSAEMCSSTGLLCDIGRLILALYAPEKYNQVVALGDDTKEAINKEVELFGTTHARVGGYLLGLWGLPNTIVQAASHHHELDAVKAPEFSILAAIQAAEELALPTDSANHEHLENITELTAVYKKLRNRD